MANPNIVFAGTPDFAAAALHELIQSGYPISLVITQPDRRSGRGLKMVYSPVKTLAIEEGIPFYQPKCLKNSEVETKLKKLNAQFLIVAAYGKIIPSKILTLFNNKCLNIHASLLPRWRGAAPIERAIMADDKETGISIMQMEEGLDTGAIYSLIREKILSNDTAGSLESRLKKTGARAIVKAIELIQNQGLSPEPQSRAGITYASKINRAETSIDWTLPAKQIECLIRALSPKFGAFTFLDKQRIKIWRASVIYRQSAGVPGSVKLVKNMSLAVECGRNALLVEELQLPGRQKVDAKIFASSATSIHGKVLGG